MTIQIDLQLLGKLRSEVKSKAEELRDRIEDYRRERTDTFIWRTVYQTAEQKIRAAEAADVPGAKYVLLVQAAAILELLEKLLDDQKIRYRCRTLGNLGFRE